jgi:hypothetical protein
MNCTEPESRLCGLERSASERKAAGNLKSRRRGASGSRSLQPERPSQQIAKDEGLALVVALCPDPGYASNEHGNERRDNRGGEQDGINGSSSAG